MRNGMVLALAVFLLSAWAPAGAARQPLLFMAARGLWLGLVDLDIERGAGFDAAPSRPAPARR